MFYFYYYSQLFKKSFQQYRMLFMINLFLYWMKYPKRLPILQFVLFLLVLRSSDANETPKTFGLTTVTHTRGGSIEQFQIYLKRYAELDCPIITQINVVWNNQQSMEELGVFQTKHLWKRPIYFYKTPNNAMDWRYKLAPQSKAEVYFSIDDDILVGCDELTKSFDRWRKAAVGSIGPLASYGPRYYTYDKDRGMAYGDPSSMGQFYAISLIGLCFVSRQFLNLYYADTFQINQIRKVVRQYNNCDDIAMNFIVSYYYPEVTSITLTGNIQNLSPQIGQWSTPNHFIYRNKCINQFSKILGINPQRYLPLNDNFPGHQKRRSVLRDQIVLQKSAYIQKFIIQKQSSDNNISNQSTVNQKQQNTTQKYIDLSSNISFLELKISELQKSLMAAKNQANQKSNEVSALKKQLEINFQQSNDGTPPPKIDEAESYNDLWLIIAVMAIVILVLCNYIFRIKRLSKKQAFQSAHNLKQIAQNSQRFENQKITEEIV